MLWRRRNKVLVIHLEPPNDDPQWKLYLGPIGSMLRTAIRGMLTLNFTRKGETFLMDTQIPESMPSVQTEHCFILASRFERAYGSVFRTADIDDLRQFPLPVAERTAILKSLNEIESEMGYDTYNNAIRNSLAI